MVPYLGHWKSRVDSKYHLYTLRTVLHALIRIANLRETFVLPSSPMDYFAVEVELWLIGAAMKDYRGL